MDNFCFSVDNPVDNSVLNRGEEKIEWVQNKEVNRGRKQIKFGLLLHLYHTEKDPIKKKETTRDLAKKFGNVESVRSAIKRLKAEKLIQVLESKKGRNGYTVLGVTIEGKEFLIDRLEEENKIGAKPTLFSNLDFIYKKKTNKRKDERANEETPAWDRIRFDRLMQYGFKKVHVQQLKHSRLTPDQIQESINAFSFDLVRGNKLSKIRGGEKGVLRYFMGILMRSRVYCPSEDFLLEKERVSGDYFSLGNADANSL